MAKKNKISRCSSKIKFTKVKLSDYGWVGYGSCRIMSVGWVGVVILNRYVGVVR